MKNHFFKAGSSELLASGSDLRARLLYAPLAGQSSAMCNFATGLAIVTAVGAGENDFIRLTMRDAVDSSWMLGTEVAISAAGSNAIFGRWKIVATGTNTIDLYLPNSETFGTSVTNAAVWSIGSGATVVQLQSQHNVSSLPNIGPPVTLTVQSGNEDGISFNPFDFAAPPAGTAIGFVVTNAAGVALAFIDGTHLEFSLNELPAAPAIGDVLYCTGFVNDPVDRTGRAISVSYPSGYSIQFTAAVSGFGYPVGSPLMARTSWPKILDGASDFTIQIQSFQINLV